MKIGTPVSSPAGAGTIDATTTHPDGLHLFRVNDHWFDARYLTNT